MSTINHVAIIMDGNGRWANSQKKSRSYGHRKGTENVRNIALAANSLNVKVLTLYAFSNENWKRAEQEVNFLMGLPKIFFGKYIDELMENNIQIRMIGSFENVPKNTLKVLTEAINRTKSNTGMILNFAFNYGGRQEILRAVELIRKEVDPNTVITEEIFSNYLYTSNMPDVDLMIRTSGEMRISNFLPWQLSYAELFFVEKHWPEFTKDDLEEIINSYNKRERRFGGN